MDVKIITDSCADIPLEVAEENNIVIVPLEVHFGDDTYLDGVDLTSEEFFDKLKRSERLPKTSSPSPEQFIKEFEGPEKDIIIITISTGLSSSYNSALLAKEIYEKENGDKEIHVINSLSGSVGQGLIVLKLAKLMQSGAKINELLESAKEFIKDVNVFFMLDTLENIVKGGRIGKATGHVASLLSIKLIMKSDGHGVVDLAEKIRGSKKAFNRLVDIVGENGSNFEDKIIAVAHANCPEKALEYISMIKEKYKFKDVLISTIGCTIGTYSGESGLIIAFL